MQMEVIGIDEAQFFDDLLEFCQSAADLDNKTVIVAGLDGDFLRYSILESAITGGKLVQAWPAGNLICWVLSFQLWWLQIGSIID